MLVDSLCAADSSSPNANMSIDAEEAVVADDGVDGVLEGLDADDGVDISVPLLARVVRLAENSVELTCCSDETLSPVVVDVGMAGVTGSEPAFRFPD